VLPSSIYKDQGIRYAKGYEDSEEFKLKLGYTASSLLKAALWRSKHSGTLDFDWPIPIVACHRAADPSRVSVPAFDEFLPLDRLGAVPPFPEKAAFVEVLERQRPAQPWRYLDESWPADRVFQRVKQGPSYLAPEVNERRLQAVWTLLRDTVEAFLSEIPDVSAESVADFCLSWQLSEQLARFIATRLIGNTQFEAGSNSEGRSPNRLADEIQRAALLLLFAYGKHLREFQSHLFSRTTAELPEYREQRLQRFVADHNVTIADVRKAADVHKTNMQDWRHGELSDRSKMSDRIEGVLSGRRPIANQDC
jgi:hypothetical protein